jgi:hypothetical protein
VGVNDDLNRLESSDMTAHQVRTIAIVALTVMAAGCSQDGTVFPGSGGLNTSSVDSSSQSGSKSNPLCLTLASQIDALNKEGIPDKVSKAALKKYKLKGSDIAKADELNKANSEFQTKCSEYPPAPTVAAVLPPEKPEKPATKVAKAKPPIPSPKSAPAASAALAPENTSPSTSSGASSGTVAETAAAPSAAQP